jgi:hypothetical protein
VKEDTMKFITETLKLAELYPDQAKALAQRLHVKKDELQLIRKSVVSGIHESVEEVVNDASQKSVISYISTNVQDRDGDVVEPTGGDFSNFERNRVVMFGHDYHRFPIGKCQWLKRDDKGILAKTVFAPSQMGDEMHRACTEDIGGTGPLLQAWSIGFIPIEWDDIVPDPTKADDPNTLQRRGRRFTKWELLEYSAVPIPSCPEALTLAQSKGMVSEAMAKGFDTNDSTVELGGPGPIGPKAEPGPQDELYAKETPPKGYETTKEFYGATEELPVDEVLRPYPNEHACRLKDPSKFDKFRRGKRDHEGKSYSIIFGHPKDGGGWEEQAYRYAKDTWTAAEAGKHCRSHDGKFEAASDDGKSVECAECRAAELKTFDPQGNPSARDIEDMVWRAANPDINLMPSMPSTWLMDFYPVNYPSGYVVLSVPVGENNRECQLVGYTIKDGEAELSEESILVEATWEKRELSDTQVRLVREALTPINDELDALLAEVQNIADSLTAKTAETVVESGPKDKVVIKDALPKVEPVKPDLHRAAIDYLRAMPDDKLRQLIKEGIELGLKRLKGKVE